jgi:hypothetical protein
MMSVKERLKAGRRIYGTAIVSHSPGWAEAGMNIILHSSDLSLFGKTLHREMSAIRSGLGEDPGTDGYSSTTI